MSTHAEAQTAFTTIARMMDYTKETPEQWGYERAALWHASIAEYPSDALARITKTYPERNKWMPKLADIIAALQAAQGELRAENRQVSVDAEGCPECSYSGRRLVAVHVVGGAGRPSSIYSTARWGQYSARCSCPLGMGFSDLPHNHIAAAFPDAYEVYVTNADYPRFTAGGELALPVSWDYLRANLRTPSMRLIAQRVLAGDIPEDPVAALLPEATT